MSILVLRTCNADMTSHNGFQWPESGPVECDDWKPTYKCGHGLHGLPWGVGNGEYLNWETLAKWIVVAVEESHILYGKGDLQDKCKFSRGVVVHCGDRLSATEYLRLHGAEGKPVVGGTATAGNSGTATAGNSGTATAGDRGTATAGYGGTATAGVGGTATAGNSGTATAGYGGTATAGNSGTATAGDRGTATAGDRGTATAGVGGTATAGYGGTATAGYGGTATAGNSGTLNLKYWDGNRYRIVIGYVGENEIEPNVPYQIKDGRLVRVEPKPEDKR